MPADDVDRIVSAWRRERPDLDVSPLEVLSRVTRLSRHLDLARRTQAEFENHRKRAVKQLDEEVTRRVAELVAHS